MRRGELLRMPVADLTGCTVLGQVADVVLDAENALVRGLLVRRRGLGRSRSFVDLSRIVSFGPALIICSGVSSGGGWETAGGRWVRDSQGYLLGKTVDFDFETSGGKILAFWLRSAPGRETTEILDGGNREVCMASDGAFLLFHTVPDFGKEG